jgi:hypothetical protein
MAGIPEGTQPPDVTLLRSQWTIHPRGGPGCCGASGACEAPLASGAAGGCSETGALGTGCTQGSQRSCRAAAWDACWLKLQWYNVLRLLLRAATRSLLLHIQAVAVPCHGRESR